MIAQKPDRPAAAPPPPGKVSTCHGTTATGERCRARPLTGKHHCFSHDPAPEIAARRQAARQAGGAARGGQLRRGSSPGEPSPLPGWWPLGTVAHAVGAYGWLARELLAGRLEARTGNAIAGVLSGLVSAIRDCDLERRLLSLEAALGKRREP